MTFDLFKSTLLSLLILTALSACGSVTPAGLWAARQLDPLQTAPEQIAIALGVPEGMVLQDGDAQFHLSFLTTDQRIEARVPLQIRPAGTDGPDLREDAETVYVTRFSSEDAAQVETAQTKIKALKAAGVQGKGTLSVSVDGGCFENSVPDALPVRTWLQTDPTLAFVPLSRRQDLFEVLDDTEAVALRDKLGICPR